MLVPCLDEAATIGGVVAGFRSALPGCTVYVYDNGSADDTARRAAEAGAVVRSEAAPGKGAVVRRMFADVEAALELLRGSAAVRVVFLDATDAVLVRRFEQVRRPHPLQGQGTLLDGIAEERRRVQALRAASDLIIDTSNLNIHELSRVVNDHFGDAASKETRVTVMSFGYKYGLPPDADLVADCRFLPNPFWIPELRPHTGQDAEVRDYVLGQADADTFITTYLTALGPVLTGYRKENKRHATIAIGCTGGKHRSVAVSEELGKRLKGDWEVVVHHRDADRSRPR